MHKVFKFSMSERLPSLAALTVNPTPTATKRQNAAKLPCHRELRYEKGEILNIEGPRIMGSDSKFLAFPLPGIPLDPPFPSSWKEVQEVNSKDGVLTEMGKVLTELYRKDGFEETAEPPKPLDFYDTLFSTRGNTHKPQYYLYELTQPATVSHIISDGIFWDVDFPGNPDLEITKNDVGKFAYTNGILWCNSSPNWSWKSEADTVIRCRIDLPAGTQVIIDRSPAFSGMLCDLDETGLLSHFPDLLLLPSEFEITSFQGYQSPGVMNNRDYVTIHDTDYEQLPQSIVKNDKQFAASMLRDVDTFLDIRLKPVRMMRIPNVE